jgi:hypothetical protein
MNDPRQYAKPRKRTIHEINPDENVIVEGPRKRKPNVRYEDYFVEPVFEPVLKIDPEDHTYNPNPIPLAVSPHPPIELDYDSINIPPVIHYPFSSKSYLQKSRLFPFRDVIPDKKT